jgi:hypothetical protein
MILLNKKKILLIAARFFGYEEEIKSKLEELGAQVDYYDQRPSNSFFAKGLIRINKNLLTRKIEKYYATIIERTRYTEYDFVLFISPETITKRSYFELRKAQPKARFILYMWDSIKNKGKNTHDIISHFDDRFSFDREDCNISHWNIKYRPLFFLNAYTEISERPKKKYDLLFIGTIHSDRFKILSQIEAICRQQNLSWFYYMYFPSKLLYYLRSLRDYTLWRRTLNDFQFHPLSKQEITALIETSQGIIDIQHPQQIGLTMRTIEVLGARRKLLTTNTDIVNYDFYHPNNIYVLDRNNLKIDTSFFNRKMVRVDDFIYNRYSIDGWISEVFSLKEL